MGQAIETDKYNKVISSNTANKRSIPKNDPKEFFKTTTTTTATTATTAAATTTTTTSNNVVNNHFEDAGSQECTYA
jgi:hypothetical protein